MVVGGAWCVVGSKWGAVSVACCMVRCRAYLLSDSLLINAIHPRFTFQIVQFAMIQHWRTMIMYVMFEHGKMNSFKRI